MGSVSVCLLFCLSECFFLSPSLFLSKPFFKVIRYITIYVLKCCVLPNAFFFIQCKTLPHALARLEPQACEPEHQALCLSSIQRFESFHYLQKYHLQRKINTLITVC